MFSRKCPSCTKKIEFKYIKQSVKHSNFNCPYCCKTLKIKTFDSLVNSIFVGFMSGWLGALLGFSIESIIVTGILTSIFLQKYLDILFSLDVDK